MCDTADLKHIYDFADRAADRVRHALGHENLVALTVDEAELLPTGPTLFYCITWKARWSDGRRERFVIVYPQDYFKEHTEDYVLERAVQKLKRQLLKEDIEEFDSGVQMG
jgi:hypothetical protein